jgi:predicted transcriptional regulator
MNKTTRPTESELEILSILWEKENATVREVHEVVQKTKDVGYTTTLKLMQIMNEKGLVTRNVSSKTHIYTPTFNEKSFQSETGPELNRWTILQGIHPLHLLRNHLNKKLDTKISLFKRSVKGTTKGQI